MTRAFSAALLHFIWQGAVVAIACWLALWLLRRRSANARYAVACAALAALVIAPAITTWALYDHPFATRHGAVALTSFSDLPALPVPSSDWLDVARTWAVPVWTCGVVLFALRMAWGCLQVATLRRRGAPADPGLLEPLAERLRVTRPVRVIVSAVAESPAVIGWLRPVILLPTAALAGLPADQLEAVVAHELAHIRRHDYLVNLLQMAAESLLFYHPAVWWISARIRHERELCCDDLAAPVCGGPIVYARALTALEKMRPPETALALAANTGSLLYRIRRLVLGDAECAPSRLSGLVATVVAALCFVLSVNWAHAQQTPPPPPQVAQPSIPSPELKNAPTPEQLQDLGKRLNEVFRRAREQQILDEQNRSALTRSFLNDQLADAQQKLETLTRQHADSRQLDAARRRVEEVQKRVEASQQALVQEQGHQQERQHEAQRNLEELQRRAQQAVAEAERAKAEIQTLEVLQAQRDYFEQQLQTERERVTAQINALNTMQLRLLTVEGQLRRAVETPGRKLARIEFKDISGQDADALRTRLPIRAGEIFGPGAYNKVQRALHEVNPKLRFSLGSDGDDVVLVIQPK